jgi:acyl transferase domain-containing protein/acyl carrier protein
MSESEFQENGREIAVIGFSGRFPGARDLQQFWQSLRHGQEAVTFLGDEELLAVGVDRALLSDPSYIKAASLLDGVEEFDAPFFGYSAREAEILDPQQRLFLEHAWEALEHAGYDPGRYDGLIGIYAGVAWNTYLLSNLTTRPELFDGGGAFQVFITNDKDFMPTRVSYKLNLKGPSMILQTSCSTSLVAIHLACLSLLNYECDMALAGGVTIKVPQRAGYTYQEGGLASPDGHCRAFDARAAGTIFGSGIGLVTLKRLSDALADGDTVHAVIKGSAINNDGAVKVSYTAPSVEGQAAVIAAALAVAGVEPETIRCVEAHGTGTSLGDPIEVAALTRVFRERTERTGFCALGSVKSNVGHLDAAAGVAGFLKTVLALQHREIPPSLHFEQPNPAIDFAASPFYVNSRLTPWESEGAPRRAGVSSFGVGGTNAHVILEEAPPAGPAAASRPVQLLLLSARSTAALEAATDRLAEWLRGSPDLCLADAAHTLRSGRAIFRHRRAVVCRDAEDAVARLAGRDPARVTTAVDTEDARDRPVVFLFPGQGAQYLGMARDLYEREPVFHRELDRCAELLRPRLGLDLRQVLYPPPGLEGEGEAQLGRTALTQPALFAVEHSLAQLWMEWGVRPQAMIGHSLGEYVAACLAGVLSLADALALVAARGRLMERLPGGAMLSVPLPAEELLSLLPARVSPAAVNEPSRTVASGPEEAIAELARRLDERGVDHRRLHTSHAFHSEMMEPVLDELTAVVRGLTLAEPKVPYISNLTGTWITPREATDPAYWARHLRSPVRFADGVGELLRDPARILLEVGPGRTLSLMAGRHTARAGQPVIASLRHPGEEEDDQETVLAALGQLWLAGFQPDWSGFGAGEVRRRVPLPTYPFEHQRYWIEPRERGRMEEQAPAADHKLDPRDWFYLPSWKPAPTLAPPVEPLRRWLLLAGEALGRRLAQRLAERGRAVTAATVGTLAQQLDALAAADGPPVVVVDARTLGVGEPAGETAGSDSGFLGLLETARELGSRPAACDWVVVSDRWMTVTAGEPLRPEQAAMLGICRVLPQEHPQVVCRAVDLEPAVAGSRREAELLDRLIAEVEAGAAAGEVQEQVALRGAQRWVPTGEPLRPAGDGSFGVSPLRRQGVYLITGGLAGPGFGIARALAGSARARLALVEQGPPDDATERTAALEALGTEVMVLTADLADEAEARRAVSEVVSRFGALHGVIHAAGAGGALRLLQETRPEDWAAVWRERVATLQGLERALESRDLEVCVLLSSLATVLGGVAWALPCAAAAVLDAFARQRAYRSPLPWRSFGWDAWQPEEEATPLRDDLAALALSPREGEEAFLRALTAGGIDHLLVSTGDLEARVVRRRQRLEAMRGAGGGAGTAAPAVDLHPRPLKTPYAAPETELEQRIAGVWERGLGFEKIGVDDNFFELGGDSFVALRVVARLNEELGIQLPVARLYQGLTIRSLAALIERDDETAERRADQLKERREVMERRRSFLQQRRANRT